MHGIYLTCHEYRNNVTNFIITNFSGIVDYQIVGPRQGGTGVVGKHYWPLSHLYLEWKLHISFRQERSFFSSIPAMLLRQYR